MWINEPVLVDLRDFKNTLRQIEVPVGVCVDIEHLFRTAILAKFYQKYESEFRDLQDEEGYDRLVDSIDSQFMEFVGNPKQKIGKIVSDFIHDFFTELRPYIKQVHVCGFDYLQDQTKHRNSGAHLPLRYQGKSGSIEVKDRVDHEQYLKYVKGTDIDVVVEVNKRSDYNHIDELRRSLQYLRGILG
jgi:hypothetical protein